jgi:hypothetical protein
MALLCLHTRECIVKVKRKLVRLHVLVPLLLLTGLVAAAKKAAEPLPELRVLFIGNSFTYVNDLPKMLADLAAAGHQRPIHWEQETPGGYTLEKHWQEGKALAKIQSRAWDFVVLQDQSQRPLVEPRSLVEYGTKFDREIRKCGAKTILYMTWANQDRPENQTAIRKAYQNLAEALPAELAPVGTAWEMALKADKHLVLHAQDRKHPSPTGTYLGACVFYATIFGQSPEGLPGGMAGLSDAAARPLQAIAWEVVQARRQRAMAKPARDLSRPQPTP